MYISPPRVSHYFHHLDLNCRNEILCLFASTFLTGRGKTAGVRNNIYPSDIVDWSAEIWRLLISTIVKLFFDSPLFLILFYNQSRHFHAFNRKEAYFEIDLTSHRSSYKKQLRTDYRAKLPYILASSVTVYVVTRQRAPAKYIKRLVKHFWI